MTKLTQQDCPQVSQKRIDSVNELSDDQLLIEIEAGSASRFGADMQPALKLAYQKRKHSELNQQRVEQLTIARKANEIVEIPSEQPKVANKKKDKAPSWPSISKIITLVVAAKSWFH